MTPDEAAAVRGELNDLWDEVVGLPHAYGCTGDLCVRCHRRWPCRRSDEHRQSACTCPLGDVLDLIRDRVDHLAGA